MGQKAPPLDESLEYLKDEHKTPEFEGKVILVEFWATWCPPCRREIPRLNTLYDKYKGQEKFQLVSITAETDRSMLKTFIEKHKIVYPVAIDKDRKVNSEYFHT